MRETSRIKETEVVLAGGGAIQVDDPFEEIMALLDLQEIPEDEFIHLKNKDGCRAAIRKRDVAAVIEYLDTEEI